MTENTWKLNLWFLFRQLDPDTWKESSPAKTMYSPYLRCEPQAMHDKNWTWPDDPSY